MLTKELCCTKDMRKSLDDFSNNTSFHGVKFIGSSKSTFRRTMWILFVLGSLAAVISQIVDRVQYFYDWPMNVDAKVKYNTSLRFPAVTICNQNAFRASEAAERNMYELVKDLYANDGNITTDVLEKLTATNYTIEDVYTLLAHQKEDFIVKCSWKKRPCEAADFRTILTDHGACFSFNQDDSEMLVSASGVGSGLQLVLNVEQYEYMPGPHGAAGIKVLLHNDRETPLVYELGEAVPTGAHAFLGIKTLMIDNVPRPYGECDDKALAHTSFYSKDECYLDCFVKFAESRCGCRDIYMPSLNGSAPVCSLEAYFSCFVGLRDIFDKQHQEKCDCPVPCRVTEYHPGLSYATISNYMVDKLIPTSHRSMMRQKLLSASEATMRHDAHKYNSLKTLYGTLLSRFQKLKSNIENITDHFKDQTMAVENIKVQTDKVCILKEKLYKYQQYIIDKNFLRPREAMEERTLRNLVDAFVEFGLNIERKVNQLANMDSDTRNETLDFLNNILTDTIIVRKDINEMARQNITDLINAFYVGIGIFNYSFEDIPESHNEYIVPKALLRFALERNAYVNRHLPRLTSHVFDDIENSLDLLLELVSTARNTSVVNKTELSVTIGKFYDACRQFMFSKSVVYGESLEYPLNVLEEKERKFKSAYKQFDDAVSVLEQIISSILTMLAEVSSHSLPEIETLIRKIEDYLKSNEIEFMEVATQLLSVQNHGMITNLNDVFETLQTRTQQIRDSWHLTNDALMDIWKTILNDTDMIGYYRFANLTDFLQPFADVEKHWSDIILPFTYTYACIEDQKTHTLFLDAFSDASAFAEDFVDSLKIDHDFVRQNFLQVDIFFKQLNYDWMKQQAAYDIFALFCDIGGSMGLFVGASILTIIEIAELFISQIRICTVFRRGKDLKIKGNKDKL